MPFEFKQIIGRGTRLYDGKDYFTIYDFVKAHHHFSDPEWDGEPLEPEPKVEHRPAGPPRGKNRECRYVGRTRGGGSRPSRHFKRGWFHGTTRVDVYLTKQKKSIPHLECLAIHRFRPTKNKVKAAKENWKPKCPLCAIHKKIRTEMRKIYRFR